MTAPDWNEDFLDFIDCLNAESAEFVVVGAFALAAHGLPRASGDIDLFVRPTQENAVRVHTALRRFGAPLAAARAQVEDFATPGTVYQIGLPPRRIDVLTKISGVTFEEAWTSRISREIDGRPVAFVGRNELLRNKRAAGRPKDLVDADALERLPTKA